MTRPSHAGSPGLSAGRARASRIVVRIMEGVLLLLVVASPWPFGSVHPFFLHLRYGGVAVLLTLWAARIVQEAVEAHAVASTSSIRSISSGVL